MWRRGEDRLGKEIFPPAGELASRDHIGAECRPAPAIADREHLISFLQRPRVAELERLHAQRRDGTQQPEAGLVVVGDEFRRHRTRALDHQLDRGGFEDEVADGQHQPVVVDDDAAAFAPGAQRCGGTGRRRNFGDDLGHRRQVVFGDR